MSRNLRPSLLFVFGSMALALLACEPQFEDHFCEVDDDCFPDERCVDEECVVQDETNECGGAVELDGEVGDPCGPCNLDQLECSDDRNELVCDGDTECPDLEVITQQPSDVEATTATFNGEITEFPEVDDLAELGFCWVQGDESPTFDDTCEDVDPLPNEPGQFSHDIEGLEPGTDYTVAAFYGIEAGHQQLMNDVDFTTAAPRPEQLDVDETVDTITVSWDELDGATGYRVYADDDELETIDDPETTSHEDDTAPAGNVSPPADYDASDDETDGVHISWDPADSTPGSEVEYQVVATYPDTDSDRSEPATGQRTAPEITGYQILVDDGDWIDTDEDDSHFDGDAPEAELTTATTTADQAQYADPVDLWTEEVDVEQSERDYELRATYGDDQYGETSSEFSGQRGVDDPDYEWERSDDDTNFEPIGATGREATDDSAALVEGSTYYYRAEVSADGAETVHTDSDDVTIISGDTGQVSGMTASEVTDSGADFDATVDELGTPEADEHGFCWATTSAPSTDDDCVDLGTPATGSFDTYTADDLEPGTTYHVRAYIHHDSVGTAYSDDEEFTTDAPAVEGLQTQTTTDTITVSWDEISAATGYHLDIEYPDGSDETVEITDPSVTSHDDEGAPAGTVTQPQDADAGDNSTDGIDITWNPADSVDGDEVDYHVVATYPDTESDPASTSAGLDGPDITGYELDIGADDDWMDIGDEETDSYSDTSAPYATIETGDTDASQAEFTDQIEIETQEPTFQQADEVSYRLRATWGDNDEPGPATDEFNGRRDHEESASYQWKRSDDDSDYTALTDVTDRQDVDDSSEIQDGEEYFYRADVSAPGAATAETEAAEGWVATAGEIEDVDVSNITDSTADFSAEIVDFGQPESDDQGFCYSTDEADLGASASEDATCIDVPSQELDNGSMSATADDLEPNTTYYFQAQIHQDVVGYTAEQGGNFTTDEAANGDD